MKSEQEIKEAAIERLPFKSLCRANNFIDGFIAGAKWMQEQDNWISVDLEDLDTLPLDFDPVLCRLDDGALQVLILIHYVSSDISCSEWQTEGLKINKSFLIHRVTHWKPLPNPPKEK